MALDACRSEPSFQGLGACCAESNSQGAMMNLKNLVRLFGVLDIALIGWLVISAILSGKIPFYTDLTESLAVAKAFGGAFSTLLAIVPYVLFVSLIFSGVLLLRHNKMGGYLALIQSPFRCIWVIQPSFFFIVFVKGRGFIGPNSA